MAAINVMGQRTDPTRTPVLGRQDECRALDEFVGTVRDGLSAALVLVGEAGIGKTTLLEYAASTAADLQVTSVAGVESEMRLGFAALHRLLRPHLDRLDRLPGPQRSALGAAFGLLDGAPPDRFLVGLAALTLLAGAARDQPLICLVDDAQWLDRESLEVLAFVGRRLHAEGVGVLLSVRDGAGEATALDGLSAYQVTGLPDPAAHQLLAATTSQHLYPEAAARIIAETAGNPLALVELAGELSQARLAARPLPLAPLPLSRRIEEHFLRRVHAMPAQTQLLLLLAAATPAGEPTVFWRAAAALEVPPEAADVAIAAGILTPHRDLVFRHPLMRSAVYGGARAEERRRVHAALADVVDRDRDPDLRAWHLAEATVGLDEIAAAELQWASERARGRGGYSAQAAFLSRAAELTPDQQDRALRQFASARAYLSAGDPVTAGVLLEQAASGLRMPTKRAEAQRLRATIKMVSGGVLEAPALLLNAIATIGPDDDRLRRGMMFEAVVTAVVSGRYTVGTTPLAVATAALRLTESLTLTGSTASAGPSTLTGPSTSAGPSASVGSSTPLRSGPVAGVRGAARPTVSDLLLRALSTRTAIGYAEAVPIYRAAIAALRDVDELAEADIPLAVPGMLVTDELWDETARRAVLECQEQFNRDNVRLYALRDTLLCLASCDAWAGDLASARARHAEAGEINAALGITYDGETAPLETLAWQGDEPRARAAAAIAMRPGSDGLNTNLAGFALTLLELSLGRYPEALGHALPVYHDDLPGFGNRVLPDLVEAAVRAGDRGTAEAATARLSERAPLSGTPWAVGVLARSRALLADGQQAESLYRDAIGHLGSSTVRAELARTHLLYGEWLRRRKRRADAREQLRVAHEMFVTMGANGFAERARMELNATGEHARKRTAHTSHDLTPHEAQVAGLAARGATNTEIATRLFITASTVEYHLSKVFRKLGLTSRRELARVLRIEPVPPQ